LPFSLPLPQPTATGQQLHMHVCVGVSVCQVIYRPDCTGAKQNPFQGWHCGHRNLCAPNSYVCTG
jgi:hypothetical protein